LAGSKAFAGGLGVVNRSALALFAPLAVDDEILRKGDRWISLSMVYVAERTFARRREGVE
jgi:hypothetical protein